MGSQNSYSLAPKTWSLVLAILLLSTVTHKCLAASSASDQSIEKALINHIAKAQKNLASAEQSISEERRRAAEAINTLETEVIALRKKTAVARRLSDEKTLSLSQLEARLDTWRQQGIYQQNILHRFLQQYANQSVLTPSPTASDQVNAVLESSKYLSKRFIPQWEPADIIDRSGKIKTLPTLAIGPVTWYWNGEAAGLASRRGDNGLQSDLLFSGGESKAIENLRAQPSGDIVFDPTLTRATARQQNSESLLQHLAKGGLWAIPILLFAFFALSIGLLKVVQLWRLPKLIRFTPAVLSTVIRDSASAQATSVKGMQRTLLDISANTKLPRQRDDLLFMQLQDDKHKLEKWIGAIAITAAVSPLLGLLGTVSGMIETFKMMTLFGSGDPEVVSGGIAQALITTELGLVVAIPALVLNAVLSRRAKNYYNELESFAILISKSDEQDMDDNRSAQTHSEKSHKSNLTATQESTTPTSRPTRAPQGATA